MADPRLQRYTEFFEQLTIDSVSQFSVVMTDDMHFVDPFNDARGLSQVQKIFIHMFESLDNPRFTVLHAAVSTHSEERALLSWEMHARLKNGQPYNIVGMSEIGFAPDGRVNEHLDHWDAAQQFYARLPVIGWLLGLIRARLTV